MRTVINSINDYYPQLEAFVDYLHAVREDERVALARKIHDELGGLLVSAAMDVGWAKSHTPSEDVRARLQRSSVSLASAIDMERNMIEQLRPTLLDNLGLFDALGWYFKNSCHRRDVICSQAYPEMKFVLAPPALSNIFRAVQTLLDCTFLEEDLRSVDLVATFSDDGLSIRVGHEHRAVETVDVSQRFRHELTSTAHRLAALGGQLSIDRHESGSEFYVQIPLMRDGQ